MPLVATEYWLGSILIPFLILSLAAIGLNILTGYAGQLSLGSAAFMAVGAFAAYNFCPTLADVAFSSGFYSGGRGCRNCCQDFIEAAQLTIKGFYLAVATLAAQFFIT